MSIGGKKPYLNLTILEEAKPSLELLSGLTIENIRDLYIKNGDIYYDIKAIEEFLKNDEWNVPLYIKMCRRYHNCKEIIAVFYHQVDPNNQRILLNKGQFKFNVNSRGKNSILEVSHEIMEFFAWVSNSLGVYDVLTDYLGEKYDINKSYSDHPRICVWKNSPIKWVYSLPEDVILKLVGDYNKTCVESWNNMFTEKGDAEIKSLGALIFGIKDY